MSQPSAKVSDAVLQWLRRHFWRHKWVYRNPFDRTCKVCGRNEVEHCYAGNLTGTAWWEIFDQGDEAKHYARAAWRSAAENSKQREKGM